jgi:hypothetical protein
MADNLRSYLKYHKRVDEFISFIKTQSRWNIISIWLQLNEIESEAEDEI